MGDKLRVGAFCAAADLAGTVAFVPDTIAGFAKNIGLTTQDISVGNWAEEKLSEAFGVNAALKKENDGACLAGEGISIAAQVLAGGIVAKTAAGAMKAVFSGGNLTRSQKASTAIGTTLSGMVGVNTYHDRDQIMASVKNTAHNLGL